MAGKASGTLCAIGIAVRQWLIITDVFACSVIDSAAFASIFPLAFPFREGSGIQRLCLLTRLSVGVLRCYYTRVQEWVVFECVGVSSRTGQLRSAQPQFKDGSVYRQNRPTREDSNSSSRKINFSLRPTRRPYSPTENCYRHLACYQPGSNS